MSLNNDSVENKSFLWWKWTKTSTKYSYTTPHPGDPAGVSFSASPSLGTGNTLVGALHTHAAYDPAYGKGNDQFSPADRDIVAAALGIFYVATPKGLLLKYDPVTGKTKQIASNMPHDRNHPDHRKNHSCGNCVN